MIVESLCIVWRVPGAAVHALRRSRCDPRQKTRKPLEWPGREPPCGDSAGLINYNLVNIYRSGIERKPYGKQDCASHRTHRSPQEEGVRGALCGTRPDVFTGCAATDS